MYIIMTKSVIFSRKHVLKRLKNKEILSNPRSVPIIIYIETVALPAL